MHLSKLYINGFKSFAVRTDLKFSNGVTCIIGPNGCGKSNIVDSIRWVIGEQRSGALRSDKMLDVIFNGNKKRKPLGLAEVSLTIVNDKGILPSEYREVVLTRRLYRDGHSEYLLNSAPCRLKDIQDLFLDTGMGSDAYSVIELKMIDQILSSNTSDRRLLFEEAAGIKRYKIRRKSAQRKLDSIKQDLLRVQDILDEIRSKVNSLNRQVEKARKYKDYKGKLNELELHNSACSHQNILKEMEPIAEKLESLKEKNQDSRHQITLDETLLENYKTDLISIENELANYRRKLFEHDEKIRLVNEQEILSKEKVKSSHELADRLRNEIESILNRKHNSEALINSKQSELAALTEKLTEFSNQLVEYENDFKSKNESYLNHKDILSQSETHQRELHSRVNRFQSEIEQLQYKRESHEKQIEKLNQFDNRQIKQLENRIKLINTDLSDCEKEEARLLKLIEPAKSLIRTSHDSIKEITEKKYTLDKRFLQLESKRNVLEDSLLSDELRPGTVNIFLEKSDSYKNYIGLLSEIIKVDKEHDQVIGSILQAYANMPVFRDVDINFIDKMMTDHPNLHFFIVDDNNIKPHKLSLSNYLKSDILDNHEIESLFGNWLFIEDPKQINNYKNQGYLLVSNTVSLSDAEHVVRLSKDSENSFSIIGAQSQIEKLEEEMDLIQEQIDQTENDQYELEDLRQKHEEKLDKLNLEFQSAEKLTTQKKNEIGQLKFELEHLQNRFEQNQKDLTENTNSIDIINSELETKEPEFKSLLLEEEQHDIRMNDSREQLVHFEEDYISAKDKLHDLNIEKNGLQSAQKSISELVEREEKFITESDQQVQSKEDEIKSLDTQKMSISTESEDRKAIIDEMQLEREKILGEKSNVEDKYVNIKEKIKDLEVAIRDHRHQRESFNETVQVFELKMNELNVKAQTIAERIYKEYDQVVTTIKIPDDFELLKSEREVFSLRNKITALGEVNSLAIEEYEKEKERLDFLSKQYDDLIKSEKLLNDTIKSINQTAKDQFQEVFDKVRKNFQIVFNQFFQRGEADIILHEDDDPLEGKIEIKVRPKGKALQTLTLMSGGEKTLTAISLLFAIYLVKPSPFCILDEVDAPLDDINISRFTSALRNFTNRTQFIVITHNKRTMEAADYMYGVTQEEEGLSKLVSVKFD